MSDTFDPSGVTVDEVVAYAEEHPDEVQAIRDVEAEGKARSTLLGKLDSMIEAQEHEDEDEVEEPEQVEETTPDFRSP